MLEPGIIQVARNLYPKARGLTLTDLNEILHNPGSSAISLVPTSHSYHQNTQRAGLNVADHAIVPYPISPKPGQRTSQ